MVKRAVVLSPDATRQFKALRAEQRARLRDAMKACLNEDAATVETTNRFRLRRPSPRAAYELRVDELRAFYIVDERTVRVELIGEKRRNALFIDGKKVVL